MDFRSQYYYNLEKHVGFKVEPNVSSALEALFKTEAIGQWLDRLAPDLLTLCQIARFYESSALSTPFLRLTEGRCGRSC